jgi:hypothetical protein
MRLKDIDEALEVFLKELFHGQRAVTSPTTTVANWASGQAPAVGTPTRVVFPRVLNLYKEWKSCFVVRSPPALPKRFLSTTWSKLPFGGE